MDGTCALCGVVLSSQTKEKWTNEFRAVYTEVDDWDGIRLSGVGIHTDFMHRIPQEAHKRWDDPDVDENSMKTVALNALSLEGIIRPMHHFGLVPFWGFGFHSVCWDLLTTLFQPNVHDLFHVCFSMRVDLGGIIDWGHEYGGAVRVHYPAWCRLRQLKRCPWSDSLPEGLGYNPYDVPAIKHLFRFLVSPDDGADQTPTISGRINMDGDMFRCLPAEILEDILIMLPSKDIGNLRRSSPAFANLSLSETFWASRFRRGNEYHYIFESAQSRPRSWRSLYFSIESLAQFIPSLVNRRRVWNLALQIESLLTQVAGATCQGHALKSSYEPTADVDTLKWHTASRGIRGPTDQFTLGCKSLRTRSMRFENGLKLRDLYVSFIQMNGCSYISGLRFIEEDGQVTSLGYIHSDQEVQVELSSEQKETIHFVSGWHLAIDPVGFRAIAVMTEDGNLSSWVGEPTNISKWCLAGPERRISALKAEFDGFKLVSLSRDVAPDTKFDHGLLWRNSCLWTPEIPPDNIIFNGTSDDYPFHGFHSVPVPFTSIIFGGPHGERLSELVEVVVHIFDVTTFTGLEFIYTDQSHNQAIGLLGPYSDEVTRSYGPGGDFRLSFEIDGPGGERIEDVQVNSQGRRFYGLKIKTNRGRDMLFPPPPDIRENQLTSIKYDGSTIVGFYLINVFPLEGLGLMSINLEEEGEGA